MSELFSYSCKVCGFIWTGSAEDYVCPRGLSKDEDGWYLGEEDEDQCGVCNRAEKHNGYTCRGTMCNAWPSKVRRSRFTIGYVVFLIVSGWVTVAWALRDQAPNETELEAFLDFSWLWFG